jgi:ketosteroid isomerase-like protein
MEIQHIMSDGEVRSLLDRFFAAFTDPSVGVQEFEHLMTPDYVQRVDGVELDFAGFVAHRTTLLGALLESKVTFEHVVTDGKSAATVHLAELIKKDGDQVRLKVIAFYKLRDRRVSYVEELTFLVAGSDKDKNLGSCMPT